MTVAYAVTYTRARIEGDRPTQALLEAAASGLHPDCSDAGSWLCIGEALLAIAQELRESHASSRSLKLTSQHCPHAGHSKDNSPSGATTANAGTGTADVTAVAPNSAAPE